MSANLPFASLLRSLAADAVSEILNMLATRRSGSVHAGEERAPPNKKAPAKEPGLKARLGGGRKKC